MLFQTKRSRLLEYAGLAILLACYFSLGVLKWNYILNPGMTKGPFLLYRYSNEAQLNFNSSYTDSLRYFFFTPKWLSTLIYGNLFLFLNLSIIYIIYRKQIFIKFTFWIFFWVSLISFIALFLGYLFGFFEHVYTIVSRIKELQQSPFTLILMLSAFKLVSKDTVRE